MTTRPGRRETSPTRVLIVEDHVLLAESIAARLAEDGYDIAMPATFSSDAIISSAREHDCDVVLLDLLLDGRDGATTPLIGPLREQGIDVVVLTGADDPHLLRQSIEAGATALLRKSCRFEDILEVLDLVVAEDVDALARAREDLRAELSLQTAHDAPLLALFARLTRREEDVLAALVAGQSPDDIASNSSISIATVRSHIHSILEKLHVHSQVAAVSLAVRSGWTVRRH